MLKSDQEKKAERKVVDLIKNVNHHPLSFHALMDI
jgi:hypothetical protein